MSVERLPSFVPPVETKAYRVTVLANRWDPDEGKFAVRLHAIGQVSARELAVEKVRDEYPDAMALRVEEVPEETPGMHDGEGGCGFAWAAHDNTDRFATGPFGCPTEAIARARWGR